MSPRLVDSDHCPHCEAPLEKPVPRVCPVCGGSLQKRYLTFGCLTSAPPVVIVALLARWALL